MAKCRKIRFEEIATVIVIRYGKVSEDTIFLGKNGSTFVWIVIHYGSSKTLRQQAP